MKNEEKISNKDCHIIKEDEKDEIILTQMEYDQILNIQHQILEMLASEKKTTNILSNICYLAESLLPNSVASIMLLNKETGLMSVRTAPSIPKIAQDRLENLKPSANGGSCGNAVFKNEPQFVQNTFTDERWKNLKQVAIDFNICSCWSIPIQDKEKNAIGSFALSSFEHRLPSSFHIKLLKTAASIVSIVLTNEKIIKRNDLLSNAMQNSSDGMIITDEKNQIIEINGAIEEIFGYTNEELLGQNPKIFSSHSHEEDFYNKMWDEIKSKSKWSGEILNRRKDGSLINQWISITSLHNQEEDISHNYLALFTDLTQIRETQNKIEFMAFHDSLTKLHNKSYLETILNTKEEKTLILLNINNFSYINTAYGFDIGDEILINISKILKNNFNVDTICKINSDEFALVFRKKISIEEKIAEIQNFRLFEQYSYKLN